MSKILCVLQINEDFPYVFLYKFLVLCFAFRAVMHLELIFIEHVRVDWGWVCVCVVFFPQKDGQLFQHHV